MVIKIKKTKKSKKQRGETTHGRGARKKGKGKGHKGGKGMAGTGKRGDQKKSLILKLYGKNYFGKKTKTKKFKNIKKKVNTINLRDIENNIDSWKNKQGEIELKKYKVLGDGEFKSKITIIAKSFTASAIEKIQKAGGKAVALEQKTNLKKDSESKDSKTSA